MVEGTLSDIEESERLLKAVSNEQIECVRGLAGDEIAGQVGTQITKDADDLFGVIHAVAMLARCGNATMELVTGYGEIWSAMTMQAYLRTQDVPAAWLDARDVLIVEQTAGGSLGDKGSSNRGRHDPLWNHHQQGGRLVRGAGAGAPGRGRLQGGGADRRRRSSPPPRRARPRRSSAAAPTCDHLWRLMEASGITMWKNVNGVYTADQRVVPEAYSIPNLKYDEAIELAYFGAQVLHPSAMQPHRGRHPHLRARRLQPAAAGHGDRGRVLALRDLR